MSWWLWTLSTVSVSTTAESKSLMSSKRCSQNNVSAVWGRFCCLTTNICSLKSIGIGLFGPSLSLFATLTFHLPQSPGLAGCREQKKKQTVRRIFNKFTLSHYSKLYRQIFDGQRGYLWMVVVYYHFKRHWISHTVFEHTPHTHVHNH